MRIQSFVLWLLAAQLAGGSASLSGQSTDPLPTDNGADIPPLSAILPKAPFEPPALRDLVVEVLERNPDVARARHRAAAAASRAPQVRALPDPVAALNVFVLPPETRVGPQQLSVSIRQQLPWFGKLALREQAALFAAAAAEAEVETRRLDVLTEARRLFYELAFLAEHEAILRAERNTLERFEEAARARYVAGSGLQQGIVRIQAQITRVDTRVLAISERRADLLAAINALRDRPAMTPIAKPELPLPTALGLDADTLRRAAIAGRPNIVAANAEIARRQTLIELAEKSFRPDFNVGLSYTMVGRRDDPAGRLSPPPDDGDDILALSGALNLPIRRRKLEAGLTEALALHRTAEEQKRQILAGIERSIGDLAARLPLLFEHWQLLNNVLHVQAREALASAETAYTTGKLNAVDLLDAEVVLFDVRTAAARVRADYAVAHARLERTIATSLALIKEESDHDR